MQEVTLQISEEKSPTGNCMNKLFLTTILFGALILSSCSAKKKIVSAKDVREKPTPEALLQFLQDQQIRSHWLTARAKVFYEDEQQTVNATLHLRMREDSLIWLSFRKFNLEAIRVKITPDSVFVLNRLEKQFAILPIAELGQQYNLPASFGNLQTLIKGGVVLDSGRKIALKQKEGTFVLSQESSSLSTSAVVDTQDLSLRQLKFRSDDKLLNINLEEYTRINDRHNFSYLRKVNIFSRSLGEISCFLNFSKVELNIPKNIRFEIPDRYTRVSF